MVMVVLVVADMVAGITIPYSTKSFTICIGMAEPSPGYQYARPGHQYLGGGGGGAQAYPTSMQSGQGGSGCFMLRYAVPGV